MSRSSQHLVIWCRPLPVICKLCDASLQVNDSPKQCCGISKELCPPMIQHCLVGFKNVTVHCVVVIHWYSPKTHTAAFACSHFATRSLNVIVIVWYCSQKKEKNIQLASIKTLCKSIFLDRHHPHRRRLPVSVATPLQRLQRQTRLQPP